MDTRVVSTTTNLPTWAGGVQTRLPVIRSNLRDQGTAEEIESRAKVTSTLRAYESSKAPSIQGDRVLLRPVYYNARCSTWGTTLPMTEGERDVHRLFSLGITGDIDPPLGPFRMTYVLGTWKLNGKVILSVSMMHPAIATATVSIKNKSKRDPIHDCLDNMHVVSECSSGLSRHGIQTDGLSRKLRGRFALRLDRNRAPSRDPDVSSVSFVNLSYTSLIFHVSISGVTWTCIPTYDTLRVMHNNSISPGATRIGNGRLFVYGWQCEAQDDSHVKISHNGTTTFVGSPVNIPSLCKSVRDLVYSACSKPLSCVQLMSTLALVSRAGDLPIGA